MRTAAPGEAWVALGSNLGDRAAHLRFACEAIGDHLVRCSPIYEGPAFGPVAQGPFLNAVAELRWQGDAGALLGWCLSIESARGRVRAERWGPRTLDLDVLLSGPEVIREPGLTVPHPGVAERDFVLRPWVDLAPDLVVPGQGTTVEALWTAWVSRNGGGELRRWG